MLVAEKMLDDKHGTDEFPTLVRDSEKKLQVEKYKKERYTDR